MPAFWMVVGLPRSAEETLALGRHPCSPRGKNTCYITTWLNKIIWEQSRLLKSRKIPLPPPFPKGGKVESSTAVSAKALLPSEREDGRDFWEGLFKKLNLAHFVILTPVAR